MREVEYEHELGENTFVRVRFVRERKQIQPMAKRVKKRKLTEDEIIQRNLDLQTAFNNYIFDHPEVLDKLPNSFRLVILPQDDPELSLLNLHMLSKRQKRGKPVVIVLMRSSGRISITAQPDVFLPLPLAA